MHKELFDQLINLLLPEMDDANARKALVQKALQGSPVLRKIQWDGASDTFAIRLVRQLDDFGQIALGKPAIVALLEELKLVVGLEQQAEIDELLMRLQSPPAKLSEPRLQATASSSRPVIQPSAEAFDGELYIFLSYARPDQSVADKVEKFLESAGIRIFRDKSDIITGDNWDLKIEAALRECPAMVLLLSKSSMPDRKEVHREWFRFDQKGKAIYPLYIQDCDLHSRFDSRNYIDAREDLQGGLDRLLQDLRRAYPHPPPSPAAKPEIIDGGQRALEVNYLEGLRSEELQNMERYTALRSASHRKRAEMRTVFEHKPMQLISLGKTLQREPETRRFENAVEEIGKIRRAVLLGEPGGGKSTTIWKLASDLVDSALRDETAPLPLLIRLGRWTDAEQSLQDFIASQLGPLGPSVQRLLKEKRAALLLDGLNELPSGQRDLKYPQIQELIEAHPTLMAIVTCREMDYTVDLKFDRINITPLDPLRISEFVVRYLDEKKGKALFWRLAGGEDVGTVWEVWKKAGASFELFWTAEDIPQENPNVYNATTSSEQDRIWQEKVRGRHSLMELARNPYMLWMLTCVFAENDTLPENRGELFRLFVEMLFTRERIPDEEQAALAEGLARTAFEMQTRRADDETGNAQTVLPKADVSKLLSERLLYLAGSASILSVGEQVRFTHQLLQEYFAARYMDLEIQAGRLKATEIWPTEKWWERTNWEEASILLAGLYSDDCSPIVEWAAEANPEVAALCITRSGAECASATKEQLRSKWLPRLTDLKGDSKPKARAAVGRALGMTGLDNRRGVGIGVDANNVVLPDIDWVEIPAGEFLYGLEEKDDDDNIFWKAAKPQKLTLPTFHLSRYPVTYAQFQTFLNDPEGFADWRWFEGLAGGEEERQISEQSFKFANHPRESVSWYQAMAFCRWLSWRFGGGYALNKIDDWAVRLPTEFEWEKAARGTDGRIYPYEGEFDAAKGNTEETGLGQTSAVGIFPNGASPYGAMDMSGNVWEWCLSDYNNPAPDARSEKLGTNNTRVLRGGSWLDLHMLARAVARGIYPPAYRFDYFGFRLLCVVSPPSL